ncbi:50S ribosomal protein L18 [Candidatus Uhrbacteria bacterium]|nr:50S ribosomal protein L18 [Candidatus Uhrbacteria bacterium]MBD3284394.1 50S ribosomal protein L18 [Candidatus Uhrbacteria bacterium]
MNITKRNQSRTRRTVRTRAKISGTAERPRLAVYRTTQHISAQLIDDASGKTLVSASDRELDKKTATDLKPVERAAAVGKLVAKKAAEQKISTAVFDRRDKRYHGRVKALADGAREGGLKF